ncbi:FRG domain-containing protein, partial [Rodentibacter genomosp. 2]|uniref:FRG domain-containing protein n=1 Tax=Rodentibacter genomosp. 2 TaxID=1908266 RepID=UPI00117BA92E
MSNIKSMADLAKRLQDLGEPKKGYTRFFRGHSNESYTLTSSIYREDENNQNDPNYLINNEDKIIKDTFTYCSDYFLPHETLFERLTKLQHYNYKTRLLDISSNSLVALYFAIAKSDKQEVSNPYKNGEIVVLDIPNEHIKYDDSDVVSILSAISLRKYDFELEN